MSKEAESILYNILSHAFINFQIADAQKIQNSRVSFVRSHNNDNGAVEQLTKTIRFSRLFWVK